MGSAALVRARARSEAYGQVVVGVLLPEQLAHARLVVAAAAGHLLEARESAHVVG